MGDYVAVSESMRAAEPKLALLREVCLKRAKERKQMTQPDGGGLRYNDGKPRYDLIPPEFMDAIATHYGAGATKYEPRNWERGMAWCKCFASMMRHAWAWMRGEDLDAETGAHHMVAVAWNAIAIYTYATRQIGEDDRPSVKESK